MITVTGHRGAKGIVPENTIVSFVKAMELGCEAIELDVHISKDGRLVVIHDERVDRTTNGSGSVTEMSLEELKELDAGNGNRIPTLDEVFETVRSSALTVQIELKGTGTEKVVPEFAESRRMTERVVFTSFWHNRVFEAKKRLPGAKSGILISCHPVDPVQLLDQAQADYLHVRSSYIDRALVETVHRAGRTIRAWGENTEISVIDRLIELEVDAIGSDRPDVVIERLKKAGKR